VDFDKEKNVVTIIRDMGKDDKPRLQLLAAGHLRIAQGPAESGAEPKPGKRMKLDPNNRQIVIYVPAVQNFATITYTLVEQKDNVPPSDPAVYDAAEGKPKKFPAIDKSRKTLRSIPSG